jgi:putative FmdB family regulatory protein
MTYEYVCTACGHEWEAEQKISEPKLKRCPQCKRLKAKRLVSGGVGHSLKGEGWARDGYK